MQFYRLFPYIFGKGNILLRAGIPPHTPVSIYIYHFSVFHRDGHQTAVPAACTGHLYLLHPDYSSSFAQ